MERAQAVIDSVKAAGSETLANFSNSKRSANERAGSIGNHGSRWLETHAKGGGGDPLLGALLRVVRRRWRVVVLLDHRDAALASHVAHLDDLARRAALDIAAVVVARAIARLRPPFGAVPARPGSRC